jgi:hypothetical protein
MKTPDTFEAILALWNSHAELSEELGVLYVTAQAMRVRKSIGDQHWPKLLQCLERRGVHLTTDDLLRMKYKRRAERKVAA